VTGVDCRTTKGQDMQWPLATPAGNETELATSSVDYSPQAKDYEIEEAPQEVPAGRRNRLGPQHCKGDFLGQRVAYVRR
jgi:hypothetical protein